MTDPAGAPLPDDRTTVVVLDTAWTRGPGDRADLVPLREPAAAVLERRDLFDDALSRLDEWADAVGLIDLLAVDGVSHWFGLRERLWHWLHERLLWRYTLAELAASAQLMEIVAPEQEAALLDVARALGAESGMRVTVEPGPFARSSPPAADPTTPPVVRRLGRIAGWPARRRQRVELSRRAAELERREAVLEARVRAIAASGERRILVLSHSGIYQPIGMPSHEQFVDPILGPVVPRLAAAGLTPVVMGLGLDHHADDEWPRLERDDAILPESLLRTRWGAVDQEDASARQVEAVLDALDRAPWARLVVEGTDLAPDLRARVREFAETRLRPILRQRLRVQRLLAELHPRALLMTHEGIRTWWLMAARREIPVFAVQHGALYPSHPGYCYRRHPLRLLPDCTFVYGDYERRVLIEHGGYRTEEVEATGSPRLDLDTTARRSGQDGSNDRQTLRAQLDVDDGERMLVVSSVNMPFIRRFHQTHMVARVLGGPLPGTRVVVKRHPGEGDDGPYRDLLVGLARAGGYEPPPITVVREIDLYRLLRAADAHLGLYSTVLTDAVAAGTPNLIATVQPHADQLGYVAAGVARAVHRVADVVDALANPPISEPAARQAFLDDHFRSGDASGRIAEAIAHRLAVHREQAVGGSAGGSP